MTTRKKLSVTLIIVTSALLIVGTIIAYIVRFGFVSLNTSSPTDWGVFGDFFSGFLGTLISIINLIVLVRLTNYVSDQDNNTALNQFRFDFYLKLIEAIDRIDPSSFSFDEINKMFVAVSGVMSFSFLFKDVKKDYELKAETLMKIAKEIHVSAENQWIFNNLRINVTERLTVDSDLKNQYNQAKSDFLLLIQSTMVK